MKTQAIIYFCIVCILCVVSLACNGCTKLIEERRPAPIPRYALFIHAGDESAPVWPLLVYTNKNDTSFHRYFRMSSYEQISEYGISLSDEKLERMKRYFVNDSIFDLLQKYLIEQNTQKTDSIGDSNYWIFLNVGKDSIISYLTETQKGTCSYCKIEIDIKRIIPDFDKRIK